MTWFLRTRLAPAPLAGLVLVVLLTALAGARTLPVPLLGGGLPPTFFMFLPAVTASLLLNLVADGSTREAQSTRPLGLLDRLWCLTWTAAAALPLLVLLLATHDHGYVASVRDVVGYTGLALLARTLLPGAVAAAVAPLFAIFAAILQTVHGPLLLTWPDRPPGQVAAVVAAAAVFVAGWAVGSGRHALTRDGEHIEDGIV